MYYKKLIVETWSELDRTGSLVSGYNSRCLSLKDNSVSILHLFVDQVGHFHLAVEVDDLLASNVQDPGVNGLKVEAVSYRLSGNSPQVFLDLTCTIGGYLLEFTRIVKQIAEAILLNHADPANAVFRIIHNWKSFWANRRNEVLSEERQIGIICELLVFMRLCRINPQYALKCWRGPLGEKHDFIFSDWGLEVKGTRRANRVHTVNGIEQLQAPENKQLAFVSFIVTLSENRDSYSLPDLIIDIRNTFFSGRPNLELHFNELLAGAGYNPVHDDVYRRFLVKVLDSTLYFVNAEFPKLTSQMLNEPLGLRVSGVKYDISLDGMVGVGLASLNWGDFFY